jgi:hypothetical protein
LVYPEQGLEDGVIGKLALQPRDDVGSAIALDRDVVGRADADP